MATNQTQRPLYFEDQYLGAEDLTAAVEYARLRLARHALGAHTWGIASGLQLVERPSAAGGGLVDVFVQPGFAWDGFGRPIVVLAPYKLPAEKFKAIAYDAQVDGGTPEGRLVEVWLRYVETPAPHGPDGFAACDPAERYSRVDERFLVEVGERPLPADRRDPLSVAGRSVDAREAARAFNAPDPLLYDESVAYQTFPAPGEHARWLIPLGLARWRPGQGAGQEGRFVARDAEDLRKSRGLRRGIGVVAASVGAAEGVIRLRDRGKDYSAVQSADLVWVEGALRVEGDARLFGGELALLDPLGKDNSAPLSVRRLEKNGQGGRSLQAQIGAAAAGQNRFDVGPVIAGKLEPRLSVLDNGCVGLGTTNPDQRLTLRGDAGTYLNVKADGGTHEVLLGADGAGGIVSTMSNHDLQLRAGGNDTKVVIKAGGAVGLGTATPLGALHVARAGHLNAVFDRTDTSDHLTLVAGGVGCGLRFSDSNFFFIGSQPYGQRDSTDTGKDLLHITADGNVGIGTPSPAARLDVHGRIRRRGQDFSVAGVAKHDDYVSAPWGGFDDWNIFVSPREMGLEEEPYEADNAVLYLRCEAVQHLASPATWRIFARCKFRTAAAQAGVGWVDGKVNYLLVPR